MACDCGISWPYSLMFCNMQFSETFALTEMEHMGAETASAKLCNKYIRIKEKEKISS